ncbi:MAG: neutral zinc metallopeptidase [Bacteroidota bacterium]
MKWQGRQGSQNIEDRRGQSSGGGFFPKSSGGGKRGPSRQQGGMGIVGIIFMLFVAYQCGIDPSAMLGGSPGIGANSGTNSPIQETTAGDNPSDQLGQFVSVVLKETEDVWSQIFPREYNRQYPKPRLVLFSGQTSSGCGAASSQTGPFYCPADQKVYIDLSFYDQLRTRFRAGGDFAMAYVIAHEVGHHIQRQLGYIDIVNRVRQTRSQTEANQANVRLELQADYLAGVWAHYTDRYTGILEEGDIDEALTAAAAIGDDNIQRQTQGYVVEESFTHGSSEQRVRYFREGYRTGDASKSTLDQFFQAREL